MAQEQPLFSFYRGDDYALKVTVTDSVPNPVDITGWDLTFTMKRNPNKDDTTASLQVNTGLLSGVNAQAGEVSILLPSAQTKNLEIGNYYFDIQAVKGSAITTMLKGVVKVLADVTWGA